MDAGFDGAQIDGGESCPGALQTASLISASRPLYNTASTQPIQVSLLWLQELATQNAALSQFLRQNEFLKLEIVRRERLLEDAQEEETPMAKRNPTNAVTNENRSRRSVQNRQVDADMGPLSARPLFGSMLSSKDTCPSIVEYMELNAEIVRLQQQEGEALRKLEIASFSRRRAPIQKALPML
jgi:hypothetical protein